jgi:hypothetical protein
LKPNLLLCGLAALALFSTAGAARGQEKKIVVGILPTYDSSGESYGGPVSQMLTGMLYQQFAVNPRFRPVFLNPGGLYDPSSTSYVAEYVQTLDTPVDMVLATTFTQPETPKKGDLILHLRSAQLDPKTGDAVVTTTAGTPLKDRSAMINYGLQNLPTGYYREGMYQPSRNFDKSPVGKAAYDLARQSAESAAQGAAKLNASGVVPVQKASATCKMTIKINYLERHAISKSYTAIIDEKEESLGIKEGILEVNEHAGPLLMQIKLNDAPYKLPKQDLYLFDPIVDCSRSSNFLQINIGPSGEASTKWQ